MSGTVWCGRIATGAGPGYGALVNGAVATAGGSIAWVGRETDLPTAYASWERRRFEGWMTPALIDCHTHLVFAGDRSAEWESRLAGASYEGTARRGGGILTTVRATRAAGEDSLFDLALPRLNALAREGVRAVEIKSGYGLDLPTELAMLRVARRLGQASGLTVRTTLLALHALPPEYCDRRSAYLDAVIDTVLATASAEGLADAVDAFCETIAFSPSEVSRYFAAAAAMGLRVKLHADQLSECGGAALAARFGALSADHLEYAAESGIAAMARAGTIAVLLPGAYATVGATQPPPVDAMRRHGVAMAVATDCNPGSSPLLSLRFAMNLACCLFRLTPEEAFLGVTRNAARALDIPDLGTVEAGKRAELLIWPIEHPRELAYWMGVLTPLIVGA